MGQWKKQTLLTYCLTATTSFCRTEHTCQESNIILITSSAPERGDFGFNMNVSRAKLKYAQNKIIVHLSSAEWSEA